MYAKICWLRAFSTSVLFNAKSVRNCFHPRKSPPYLIRGRVRSRGSPATPKPENDTFLSQSQPALLGISTAFALVIDHRALESRWVGARLLPVRLHIHLSVPLEVDDVRLVRAAALLFLAPRRRLFLDGAVVQSAAHQEDVVTQMARAVCGPGGSHGCCLSGWLWVVGNANLGRGQLPRLGRAWGGALVSVPRAHDGRQRRLIALAVPAALCPLLCSLPDEVLRQVHHELEEASPLPQLVLWDEDDAPVDGHARLLAPGGGKVEHLVKDVLHVLHYQHICVKEHQVVRAPLLV
mmetsp:Transcript_34317/g.75073  ORF Transcript_34317/g.75073 Transcript_34317/m.75073 type:complete len:293 (+) Transcript_34317:36-914(+)